MTEKICRNCRYYNDFSHNCSTDGRYVSEEDFCEGYWGYDDD